MSDSDLKRLRRLRTRAQNLLVTVVSDLKPFRHDNEAYGFRRKPDSSSPANDVNVTTTCSCLMALALADKVNEFYGDQGSTLVSTIFNHVVDAPWMSSGLSENNAFTTTLVIRLLGLLVDGGFANTQAAQLAERKSWESVLPIKDVKSLAAKLVEGETPFSAFLYKMCSDDVQAKLRDTQIDEANLRDQLSAELLRLIRTADFYDKRRFAKITLSEDAKKLARKKLHAYEVAQLNRILLHDFFPAEIAPLSKKSIREIALDMSSEPSTRFKINEYPPSAAVLYWFVDGVSRAQISLPAESWTKLCRSATEEFTRQRSLVVAKHAAMMDPVAMAMSACLCARLRAISQDQELRLGMTNDHTAILPSTVELERAVIDLFAEQTNSGIWPKYFPLFHYQDAGSNFCFTFELLEAVLVEFGRENNRLLNEETVVAGLERAVNWCEENRLQCSETLNSKSVAYEGWNSGGYLETLKRGQPESWATGVVHMFLWELVDVLSRHIQEKILDRYSAVRPTKKWRVVEELLDVDLWLDRKHKSLKDTLTENIIRTFDNFRGADSKRLRKKPIDDSPLSALLFGPPGTSKTETTKAIAAALNWPMLEIDPSHFLQDSFQNIYVQAEKIFEDVMDLCGVVVLFDEVDALVQKRDGETSLDTESKFLTTYMLPKLAKLHERGQLIFLMATNFQQNFDDAIKRAGRFDFLLCMGPPTLTAKCESIHVFFKLKKANEETRLAGQTIKKYAMADPWLEDQLSLYTYGDFLSFITARGTADDIGKKIVGLKEKGFRELVKADCESIGLKLDDLQTLKDRYMCNRLVDLDAIDFNAKELEKEKIDCSLPAIKYILDRKQTRRQCRNLAQKV